MKKLGILFTLAASFAFGAIASEEIDAKIAVLNAEIAQILAPFQNNLTEAGLVFSEIKTDEVRALDLALSAFFKKTGTENVLSVNVENLSYHYDALTPTTSVSGSIGLDLTKILTQEQINEMIPEVEGIFSELAKSYTAEYGDAITIDIKVSEKTKDEAGNFTAVSGDIVGKIDLTKLPETKKLEDLMFQGGQLHLALDVKKGATIKLTLISNPDYKGFKSDGEGLKDMLDKLAARDAKTMKEIEDTFKWLDSMADGVVNKKSQ